MILAPMSQKTETKAQVVLTNIMLSDDIPLTFSGKKTLLLEDSGLDIRISEDEKTAMMQQAEEEFDQAFLAVFKDLLEKKQALEESGTPLKLDDGTYNPDWDAAWNALYPSYTAPLYATLNGILAGSAPTQQDAGYQNYYNALAAYDGNTNTYPIYLYLLFWFANTYGAPTTASTDSAAWKNTSIAVWGYPVPQYGNVGSVLWFQQVYDTYLRQTEDPLLLEQARRIRAHYAHPRYADLLSAELRERIGDQLNLSFSYTLEPVPAAQSAEAGIGASYSTLGEVKTGTFADPAAASIPFATVNFGAPDQYYDPDLSAYLKQFFNGQFQFKNGICWDLSGDPSLLNDYYEMYLYLFGNGSLKSEGGLKRNYGGIGAAGDYSIWPYSIYSRGFETDILYESPLAVKNNYFVLKAMSRDDGLNWNSWGYGNVPGYSYGYQGLELMGFNGIGYTGYDWFEPEFDTSGKVVSMSKPLINAVGSPEGAFGEYEYVTSYGTYLIQDFNPALPGYGFTRSEVLSLLSLPETGIYRYFMKETHDPSQKLNGHSILYEDKTYIVDILVYSFSVNGQEIRMNKVFCFENTEQADTFYQALDAETSTMDTAHGTRLNKYAGKFVQCTNQVLPDVPWTPEAEVTVDGEAPASAEHFRFALCDESGTVLQTVESSGAMVSFAPVGVTWEEDGKEHVFTVYQLIPSDTGGLIYDTAVFTWSVTVSLDEADDGTIVQTVSAVCRNAAGTTMEKPWFNNRRRHLMHLVPDTGSLMAE